MQQITWHIWGEAAEARLVELLEYLGKFPHGSVSSAARSEVEYLEYLRDHGAAPGGRVE